MDPAAIRQLFADFAGERIYRRFVRTLNAQHRTQKRLRFWQESLWSQFLFESDKGKFILENEELEASRYKDNRYEVIADTFAVCDVHGAPLRREEVKIVYGLFHFPDELLNARETEFPFANDVVYGGCTSSDAKIAEVLYCATCRGRQDQWNEQNQQAAVLV